MRVFELTKGSRTRRYFITQGAEWDWVVKDAVIRACHKWLKRDGGSWEDIAVTEGASRKPYPLPRENLPEI